MKRSLLLVAASLCCAGASLVRIPAQESIAGAAALIDKTPALKQFDRDQDGRLSDAEREVMHREIAQRRLKGEGSGRGRMMFRFPPEIVEKYDKDKDGELNEEESTAARDGMRKMWMELQRKYDRDGDGRIDEEEGKALQKDMADGKLEGVPRFFGQIGMRRGGRGRPGGGTAQEMLRKADADGDGRLSAGELEAARAARAKAGQQADGSPK